MSARSSSGSAAPVLGAHELRRAQDIAELRQPRRYQRGRPGQAKVGQLGQSVRAQEDVAGLDVAVDEVRRVGRGEAAADVGDDPRGLAPGQGALAPQPGLCAAAGHQLHDDVGPAVALADVVHGDDVGMVEPGRRPRLQEEPLERLVAGGWAARQDLDRHGALQPHVFAGVDGAHAAPAEPPRDAIPSQFRMDGDVVLGHRVQPALRSRGSSWESLLSDGPATGGEKQNSRFLFGSRRRRMCERVICVLP